MTRIGITGTDGFLGWHLRAFLHAAPGVTVVAADRHTFADAAKLRDFIRGADALVHLAGANRGDDRAMRDTNITLAEELIAACTAEGTTPHIVFANSTHSTRASAYGESKRIAAEKFAEWAGKTQATFTNLVIPHAFGERGRPHYNSAIATFCHQLANGEAPRIIQDAELELIHAQHIAEEITAIIDRARGGEIRLHGAAIRVSEALSLLQRMAREYSAQIIPALQSPLELDLFNTYRWHLFPKHYPVDLDLRSDTRGNMFDAVKSLHGGQCMVSTTKCGVTRGNHYHRRKLERFLVLQGEALIRVRRLLSDDITEYHVSGARPQFVDMPTLHTHNITNTGSGDLTTLFWTQEIFDAKDPDTYPEKV